MYSIEVNNEYRNEYGEDYFPMHYYKVTYCGYLVQETDWTYGFADAKMASSFMEAYHPGEPFTITGME